MVMVCRGTLHSDSLLELSWPTLLLSAESASTCQARLILLDNGSSSSSEASFLRAVCCRVWLTEPLWRRRSSQYSSRHILCQHLEDLVFKGFLVFLRDEELGRSRPSCFFFM
ncbi:hypothetical protein GQ53DRAFT_451481 [Thozetella sp. PMI_491]|nr:hypothetical protein GQ53DRAFT_451481 [Thozetella sp. PMI_491]